MKSYTSWLTVLLIVCFLLPVTAFVLLAPEANSESEIVGTDPTDIEYSTPDSDVIEAEKDAPFYPEFPELPAPPAPNSPYYAHASPPPDYISDETRASRIKFNTNTVISIDSPKNLDFVTLGQNFIVSGGVYEDNNSNGKNDTGDIPIPNAQLHFRWADDIGFTDTSTDSTGRFSVSISNDKSHLAPIAHRLEVQFWGQWTINGTAFYEIPRYNISTNIPGFDDDNDELAKTTDGFDNDGDWVGWDGSNYNNDTNHNNQTDFDYDGVEGNDDDGDGLQDEETLNGIDDDGDGLVDEDCVGGDANGDGDASYDPEPNVDEPGEGIDEEGIPNGLDSDGDSMIDEDNLLPFIPRLNTTIERFLIIQHRTDISLSISPRNA